MKSYKDPSFQDRVGRAAEAKQKALDQLRGKPAVDEALLAERAAARQVKATADAEKRAAKKAAEQQAKADKAEEAARQKAAKSAATPTEAELKAARDARYAARKSRK